MKAANYTKPLSKSAFINAITWSYNMNSYEFNLNVLTAVWYYIFLSVIILFPMIFCGCGSGNEPSKRTPAIYGIVKDSSGNPVAGAYVCLYFELLSTEKPVQEPEDSSINYPNPYFDNVSVQYYLPKSAEFNMRIAEKAFGDIVFNYTDSLESGTYNWIIDFRSKSDSMLTRRPGIYDVFIEYDSIIFHRKIFHNIRKYETSDPFAITDSTGRFTFYYNQIPAGFVMRNVRENGALTGNLEVSDTITVRALSLELQKVSIIKIIIDTTKIHDINLIL